MTARIIVQEELKHTAFLVISVPFADIDMPERCETTITLLTAKIGAVLRAMADPEQATAALGDAEREAA